MELKQFFYPLYTGVEIEKSDKKVEVNPFRVFLDFAFENYYRKGYTPVNMSLKTFADRGEAVGDIIMNALKEAGMDAGVTKEWNEKPETMGVITFYKDGKEIFKYDDLDHCPLLFLGAQDNKLKRRRVVFDMSNTGQFNYIFSSKSSNNNGRDGDFDTAACKFMFFEVAGDDTVQGDMIIAMAMAAVNFGDFMKRYKIMSIKAATISSMVYESIGDYPFSLVYTTDGFDLLVYRGSDSGNRGDEKEPGFGCKRPSDIVYGRFKFDDFADQLDNLLSRL